MFVLRAPPLEDHLAGKETNEKLPYIYVYAYIFKGLRPAADP